MGRRSDDLEVRRHKVETGYTREGHVPYATIKEFFALVGTGATHQEATENLRAKYRERIRHMTEQGFKIPVPGAQPESPRFASNDQVEALRPFADRFWSEVLGTPYSISFVSNESRLSAWEHYAGGRDQVIARVLERFGVDITPFYDQPIPIVLQVIRGGVV